MKVRVLCPFAVDGGPAHQVGELLEVEVGLGTRLARYSYVEAVDRPAAHVSQTPPAPPPRPSRLRSFMGVR